MSGSSIYPGATVDLSVQEINGREQPVVSESTVSENGSFALTSLPSLTPGQYVGFVTVSVGGQQSPPSTSFMVTFEGPSFIDRLIELLNQTISLVLIGIFSAFILGFACGYFFFKKRHTR